ncbi:MAG: AMP-binding protein, partial [Defluviitaleaceae bacterium]|nr:AMP-binding protein [Defluviitaleaceae bacterium]
SFISEKKVYKRPVAVLMEKSPQMIAAFLGAAYGGCFYVPIETDAPALRIKTILDLTEPGLVIIDESARDIVKETGQAEKTARYDEIIKTPIDDFALDFIRRRSIDADPAYVVFTSGSTGVPKGVVASHRSVIDYIENLSEVLRFNEDTVFGNQAPLNVDACLKEIYPTLKFGATTHLIPKRLFMFPVKLIDYLNEKKIDTICWVVSALTMISGLGALDKHTPGTLGTIAFGGEVFPVKQFNIWKNALPGARFVQLYGPTEATGMSSYYEADRLFGENESIPIGRPFKNTGMFLLNEEGKEPKQGEKGEICIRGACLCLGYFKDRVKTEAAFVQNPLSVFPDAIYKTGDIGVKGDDGNFYYVCRLDQQIKHMGHRIELAEIEHAAAGTEGVNSACAVYDQIRSRITLYYATRGAVTAAQLIDRLKKTLPGYMLPYACERLDQMPLTQNGKIDRAGLLKKILEEREA